ncbi:MAG: hypothetical protein JST10_08310 [Bacteroidetes bacterium]|nr:hypothetical protein [Bacteroidota bacterium]
MAKRRNIFFVLCVPLVISVGIYCGNNNLKSIKSIDSSKHAVSADTIIDPIQIPACDIVIKQKNIVISQRKGFPQNSIGDAVLNVVISKSGKLESWRLIYLKIIKEMREIYILDQSRHNDSNCPQEIEFICDKLSEELNKAPIICDKENKKETRLRIPVKLKFE